MDSHASYKESIRRILWILACVVGLVALAGIIWYAEDILDNGLANAADVNIAFLTQELNLIKSGTKPTTSSSPASSAQTSSLNEIIATRTTQLKPSQLLLTGNYVLGVSSTVSLAQASSAVSTDGYKVLYSLQYAHALIAQLTPAQVSAYNSLTASQKQAFAQKTGVTSRDADIVANSDSSIATQSNSAASTYSPLVQQGDPRVAIVDNFTNLPDSNEPSHGWFVLAAYQAQCILSNCGIMNPTLVSSLGPDGLSTIASSYNGVGYAIYNGAHIVNTSWGPGCPGGVAECDANLAFDDDVVLNILSLAQSRGALIVSSAGNSANYINLGYSNANPFGMNMIFVGALSGSTVASYSSIYADVFAQGQLSPGIDGTSYAAPSFAAQLVASMNNLGQLSPTNEVIADAESYSGFVTRNNLSINYNSDGTLQDVNILSSNISTNLLTNYSQLQSAEKQVFDSGPTSYYTVDGTNDDGSTNSINADGTTDNTPDQTVSENTNTTPDTSVIDNAKTALDSSASQEGGTINLQTTPLALLPASEPAEPVTTPDDASILAPVASNPTNNSIYIGGAPLGIIPGTSSSGTLAGGISYTMSTDYTGNTTVTSSYTPTGTRIPYTVTYQTQTSAAPDYSAQDSSDDSGESDFAGSSNDNCTGKDCRAESD